MSKPNTRSVLTLKAMAIGLNMSRRAKKESEKFVSREQYKMNSTMMKLREDTDSVYTYVFDFSMQQAAGRKQGRSLGNLQFHNVKKYW